MQYSTQSLKEVLVRDISGDIVSYDIMKNILEDDDSFISLGLIPPK